MRPLLVVWPHAAFFWPVFAWVFWPEWRIRMRARQLPKDQDAGSLRLIVASGPLSLLLALGLLVFWPAATMAARWLFFALGVGALLAGGLLRRHCFRMLGTRFTGAVVVTPDQPVIERGAYHWIRHPGYSAGILIMAALGLALGNWASLLTLVVFIVPVYLYRVVVEERALSTVLGGRYQEYMRRTKRFVPFVV